MNSVWVLVFLNPTLNAGSERIPLYPSWVLRLTEHLDDLVG